MKINLLKTALIGALSLSALVSTSASAHGRWLLPSHTSLSGDKAHYVMIDASISNEMFAPDKAFKPKEKGAEYDDTLLMALAPNGEPVSDTIRAYYLKRKSSAAVSLTEQGTYHIAMTQKPMYMTFYKNEEGKRQRVFGKKTEAELPSNAKDVTTTKVVSTVDTFVSRNGTSKPAQLGLGLELSGPTHPNDLFVGEQARFQLLQDGKSAGEGVEVSILKGDTRYRNERGEVKVTTDKDGMFTITWKEPGLYLIETSNKVTVNEEGVDAGRYALFTTLEVAPE
ncbi:MULTISPECIES: DUF4198 domain-containing protein [Pseudoalteromonas]|jgi:uncharacterized GH25 family protein|uniref:DUF4198 domain-containing protein n=1 Tax=Pseudoalteromonas TaxID=53246 RepID=UPI0015FBD64B|nr:MULTISPECIES: DUF4198 domain-containing protein [unclassified Pseudoalteromonas]MBB1277285.1 DUF4198 domain-containing protein [Pseudoalteromonas sp. SR43-3]MBB1353170.1 DUF4198 domain-containing protein [Pseudoalteromonas sp. SR45-5]MBB1455894.1 DUF4198 domain-containing protein [Pseudoalteromonas sp. SG43-5]